MNDCALEHRFRSGVFLDFYTCSSGLDYFLGFFQTLEFVCCDFPLFRSWSRHVFHGFHVEFQTCLFDHLWIFRLLSLRSVSFRSRCSPPDMFLNDLQWKECITFKGCFFDFWNADWVRPLGLHDMVML